MKEDSKEDINLTKSKFITFCLSSVEVLLTIFIELQIRIFQGQGNINRGNEARQVSLRVCSDLVNIYLQYK